MKTVTTRIDDKKVDEIDKLSKEFHMDRATMLRNLIDEGYQLKLREWVVQLYRKDKISSGKVREILNIDFDEWLKLMKEENLHYYYDEESRKEDLKGLSV